jgi:DNA-damage-inducible protein D
VSEIQPFLPQSSPFDDMRRTRINGSEYWTARDLQPVMGYAAWRDFTNAVERAKAACINSGALVTDHFADARKVSASGPDAEDFVLTRYGAYLVAMNGDPRKREIAEAQTYFAVKTREAETARPRELSRKELALMVIEAEEALEAERNARAFAEFQVLELAPAARMADELMEASGDYSVREAAQILDRDPRIQTGQKRLFEYLRAIGWIDRHNQPYQAQITRGRLTVRARSYEHPNRDELVATQQVRITPKGLGELHRLLGGVSQLPALMSEQGVAS